LTAGPSRVAVFSLLFSLFALAAPVKSSSAARLSVQTPDAAGLVAKIGERIASHPKLDSWRARADSTTFQMNSDWKPKKTTTTEKNVTVDDGRWSEEILSASETEDGKTRDITKKLQEEARDRAEKQARQTPDERKNEQQSRGRRSLDMTRDEVLPFGPDKRSGYDFTVKGATELDGMPVILLQSRSRVRSKEKLGRVDAVEIKFGQSAKPGRRAPPSSSSRTRPRSPRSTPSTGPENISTGGGSRV